MTSFWCERLWQPDGVREGVLIGEGEPYRLSGLVFPGFANVHGLEGIRFMLEASDGLALRVFVMLSSCARRCSRE